MNRDDQIRATGINLYPEMNEKIVRILRIGDNPADLYAAALIEQLAADLAVLREQAEQTQTDCDYYAQKFRDATADLAAMTAERDAAVRDFTDYVRGSHEKCAFCKHDDECEPGESLCYGRVSGWEWRGPNKENTNESTTSPRT